MDIEKTIRALTGRGFAVQHFATGREAADYLDGRDRRHHRRHRRQQDHRPDRPVRPAHQAQHRLVALAHAGL